jgi:cytochrome c oxidase subunit I
MFATGLGPVANTAFGITTAIIAVPTGVKIFNWMGTMYGGDIRFDAPMLYAVGAVAMFVIGGLSGVTHSIVPSDYQQTDTYYIVAHFHYFLFGGAIFGIFAAAYYWWPKVFAKLLSERMGKIQFWMMIVGFNLTFGPMHILGLGGMIRRTYTYPASLGLTFWNQVSTVGAFMIALSVALFVINVVRTQVRPSTLTTTDPWDARTLEWTTACPPPPYNFEEIPTVRSLDDFWHRKYAEDESGRLVRVPAGASGEPHPASGGHGIHLPSPSFWPLVVSLGFPLIGYGVLYSWWWVGLGAAVITVGLVGWALEPSVAE